jgi:hypothetical protein
MRTMDLTDLKPYFHGTTSRIGAPFCAGSARPYSPVASSASGCMASSSRTHKRRLDILEPTQQTIDALGKLDLAAGVDVEIKLQ